MAETEPTPERAATNRYGRILERLFFDHYTAGAISVDFDRSEIGPVATALGIKLPSNVGDMVYSFRYRASLPSSISSKAPSGRQWIILPVGRGKYRFSATPISNVNPRVGLVVTKVPDATPSIIISNGLGDEQALLAKVRYNRLIDMFLGIVCYSLQNHLRTTVPDIGQIETDEIYVGIDKPGRQYVVPVQAKRGSDKLSIVQIWQDVWLCQDKFAHLLCRPVAAIQMPDDVIALMLFEKSEDDLVIADERHYRLVEPANLPRSEIKTHNSTAI